MSGGADSVCLLRVLSKAFALEREEQKSAFPKLVCVTVDHSIRPESESSGDAAFVAALCEKFGVECFVKKIERGLVDTITDVTPRDPAEGSPDHIWGLKNGQPVHYYVKYDPEFGYLYEHRELDHFD